MKICMKCGYQNDDSQNYCGTCGSSLNVPGSAVERPDKVAAISIIALVLAIVSMSLSLLTGGLYVSLASVICGIIGVRKGGKNKTLCIIALILGGYAFITFAYRYIQIQSIFSSF